MIPAPTTSDFAVIQQNFRLERLVARASQVLGALQNVRVQFIPARGIRN